MKTLNNHRFLNFSLFHHPRKYKLEFSDSLMVFGTGFSGGPYAIRHFQIGGAGHILIGLVESMPVLGMIASLIEKIAVEVFKKISTKLNKMRLKNLQIKLSSDHLPNEEPSDDFIAKKISPLTSLKSPVSTKPPKSASWFPRTLEREAALKKMFRNSERAIKEHRAFVKSPYAKIKEAIPSFDAFKKDFSMIPEIFSPALGFSISKASARGKREEIEDAFFYKLDFPGGPLLGVLDGHKHSTVTLKGNVVAEFLAKQIPEQFWTYLMAFGENVHSAMEALIRKLNEDIFKVDQWKRIGSTAIFSWIDKQLGTIYTATLGDSKGMICRQIQGVWKLIPLSCERNWASENDWHRFTLARPFTDREELYREKGRAKDLRCKGLNVARCFGDREYNVIDKPKLTINKLKLHDVLIYATDGLWDYLAAAKLLRILNNIDLERQSLAQALVNAVNIKRNKTNVCSDNVTVLVMKVF